VKEVSFRLGYEVVSRTSPIEALGAFRAESGKFDLVITDIIMPERRRPRPWVLENYS
jgi:CheY-like chemotaxis protein